MPLVRYKIILLCHYIQYSDNDLEDEYHTFHSNSELIILLNSLYHYSIIPPSCFQYPLNEARFKKLLFSNQISTLDWCPVDCPVWGSLHQKRKKIQHFTFDQDLSKSFQDPQLIKQFETFDLAILVNAPTDTVRMVPNVYRNILSLLKPNGYFLAEHRAEPSIFQIPNHPSRLMIESAVYHRKKMFSTFVRIIFGRLRIKTCRFHCISRRRLFPQLISLHKQFIYQKKICPE